jgi:hypothetical protein
MSVLDPQAAIERGTADFRVGPIPEVDGSTGSFRQECAFCWKVPSWSNRDRVHSQYFGGKNRNSFDAMRYAGIEQ